MIKRFLLGMSLVIAVFYSGTVVLARSNSLDLAIEQSNDAALSLKTYMNRVEKEYETNKKISPETSKARATGTGAMKLIKNSKSGTITVVYKDKAVSSALQGVKLVFRPLYKGKILNVGKDTEIDGWRCKICHPPSDAGVLVQYDVAYSVFAHATYPINICKVSEDALTSARHVFEVHGLSCAFCTVGIEKTFNKVKGVKSVSVSLKHSRVTVYTDKGVCFSKKELTKIFEKTGFSYQGTIEKPESCGQLS